jgi:hypothetical protein
MVIDCTADTGRPATIKDDRAKRDTDPVFSQAAGRLGTIYCRQMFIRTADRA